jgi:hypothetical protein
MFCDPYSFSNVPRVSGPVFIFCAPGLVYDGTEGVRSHFHVLRPRTHFRRYRRCRVPFSCFAFSDVTSAVPTASGPIFMFSVLALVFDGTVVVGPYFHVLHYRTRFRRYRGRQVPFSYFVRPDSFSAVPRASGTVFMLCVPILIFGGTEGVGFRFHVLRPRTRFRRYRGPRVPFSYFARSDSFSTVPRASGPVFMFCAPGHVFDGAEGVGSLFLVLRSRTHFGRTEGVGVPF